MLVDHVSGWAVTRTTTLERLARLCRWHHHLKTYRGYRLEGQPGEWRLVAPEAPTEGVSDHSPPAAGARPSLDLEGAPAPC